MLTVRETVVKIFNHIIGLSIENDTYFKMLKFLNDVSSRKHVDVIKGISSINCTRIKFKVCLLKIGELKVCTFRRSNLAICSISINILPLLMVLVIKTIQHVLR